MKSQVWMACLFGVGIGAMTTAAQAENSVDAARSETLTHLLKHDCGSCHGITLQGGLGPSLTPDALADKPTDYLESIIGHGVPETAMPPWLGILSPADISWLAQRIRTGVAP